MSKSINKRSPVSSRIRLLLAIICCIRFAYYAFEKWFRKRGMKNFHRVNQQRPKAVGFFRPKFAPFCPKFFECPNISFLSQIFWGPKISPFWPKFLKFQKKTKNFKKFKKFKKFQKKPKIFDFQRFPPFGFYNFF